MATGSFDPVCPSCRQRTPVVMRGIQAHCVACGAPRGFFGSPSVNLAGQPSRIGGIAAVSVGVFVLVLGLSLAALFGLILQSVFPASFVGWAVAIPIVAMTLLFGLLLVLGGRRLRRHGEERKQSVQLGAVKALIAHRSPITALDVASALQVTETEADRLLTILATHPDEPLYLDVDDNGQVLYGVTPDERRFRVLEEQLRAAEQGEGVADETALADLRRREETR